MVGRLERKEWGGRYCVVVALQTRLDASLDLSGDCNWLACRLRCVDLRFGGKV